MIVQMETGLEEDHEYTLAVVKAANDLGVKTQVKTTGGRHNCVTEVYLIDGEKVRACSLPEHVFRPMFGVDQVRRVTPSMVSLAANGKTTHHRVRLGSVEVGKGMPCQLIVGPCTVDRHIYELAMNLADQGEKRLRGGCWKPRSDPHSFPGFGKKGVTWLLEAARNAKIEVVFTEVIDETHIEDVRRIRDQVNYEGDIVLWVGARTSNQILLRKLGKQREFPVMIKNPIRARSVQEWIKLAEFVIAGQIYYDDLGELIRDESLQQGNDQILLCSRGVEQEDSESSYRFEPRHHWIDTVCKRYWPPVGVDPSHSAGTMVDDLVLTNLRSALIHKPAFVIIETYFDADNDRGAQALCDGQQAVPLSRLVEVRDLIQQHNSKHYSQLPVRHSIAL